MKNRNTILLLLMLGIFATVAFTHCGKAGAGSSSSISATANSMKF